MFSKDHLLCNNRCVPCFIQTYWKIKVLLFCNEIHGHGFAGTIQVIIQNRCAREGDIKKQTHQIRQIRNVFYIQMTSKSKKPKKLKNC